MTPTVDLVGHIVVNDNGAGDELGEERDVQQQLARIPGAPFRVAVHIDDVTHPLEGVKGDADGQHNAGEGQFRSGQAVKGGDDEVHILEHAQKGEIGRRRQARSQAAVALPGLKPQSKEIVDQHADEQQHQVGQLSKGEKHQAGQGEPGVAQGQPRQNPVPQIGHRQKDKQENRRTEYHVSIVSSGGRSTDVGESGLTGQHLEQVIACAPIVVEIPPLQLGVKHIGGAVQVDLYPAVGAGLLLAPRPPTTV